MTDSPNPERRSSAAMWCLALGMVLLGVAWLLGFGGVFAAAITNAGRIDADVAPSIGAWAPAVAAAVVGALLCAIGFVWVVIRVIADARAANANERYRDVER